jgi:tetratricopeptide (TPR) repeat protein
VNLRTNLSTAYMDLQRWEDAEQVLFQGLEISMQHQGEDSLEARSALFNLSTVWNGMGRFAEAEELMRSLVEKEIAQHGETHLRSALARSNHAICLFNLGRVQEALELQELALGSTPPGLAERAHMERSLEIYRGAVERRRADSGTESAAPAPE